MINSSDNLDNVPTINNESKNLNSSYFLQLDNPSSINCFAKINSADYLNGKNIVYIGTNLNVDIIIQSLFWLLLFSIIPKDKKISKLKIGDFPQWDSLGNFNLLLEIEKQFSCRIDTKSFKLHFGNKVDFNPIKQHLPIFKCPI